jgi:membrane dipeptidase
LNRREFNHSLLGFSLAAMLRVPHPAEADPATVFPAIAALYKKSLVMDSLCSPFADPNPNPTPELIASVRAAGISGINNTISELEFEATLKAIAAVESWVERYPDSLMIVRRYSDIARAKQENKLGLLHGFQYTAFFEDQPERVAMFRNFGVRIMQITYNKHSAFGDGCLEPKDNGLTPAGTAVVKKMNELGIAVDLSHSGYVTTADGIKASARPVLISHSGCAAVYAHPRNKPDNVMKLLSDRGGYFGVYLMPYLCASPRVPTLADVLDHMTHAINVCGADHVGVGCDNPIEKITLTPAQKATFEAEIAKRKQLGIGAPGEDRLPYVPDLSGPDHMLLIADGLSKRGQNSAVIEKVLGANFQRVLGEIWGTE